MCFVFTYVPSACVYAFLVHAYVILILLMNMYGLGTRSKWQQVKTGSKKQTSGEQEQEGVCSWQGCV